MQALEIPRQVANDTSRKDVFVGQALARQQTHVRMAAEYDKIRMGYEADVVRAYRAIQTKGNRHRNAVLGDIHTVYADAIADTVCVCSIPALRTFSVRVGVGGVRTDPTDTMHRHSAVGCVRNLSACRLQCTCIRARRLHSLHKYGSCMRRNCNYPALLFAASVDLCCQPHVSVHLHAVMRASHVGVELCLDHVFIRG